MLAGVRRGILGGTFDPPHMAHLVAGEAAYRQGALDVVSYVPAGAPWQKADRPVTGPHHRLAMTRLATEGVDYFEVDDCEVARSGWTYTVDTLLGYPDTDELVLVLGADAAVGLQSWHRHEDVVARAEVAVLPRPGVSCAAVEEVLRKVRHRWLDTPELAVSGTALRRHAAAGRSIRFLVPDAVWRYVAEHQLYGGPSGPGES